ncbi:energy transducer TonB [Lutimonas sp.]|uniref:energy transducer TonB n=1 Tax=Lutimonas sp. TaxID=1872403 RepID=UPI003D9AE6E6
MINYIVQVLLFQIVFMAFYDLIIRKETFFQWNRAYLILTSLLAYVLPLLKFQTVKENIPQEYVVMVPEIILSPSSYIEKQINWSVVLFQGLGWFFFTGLAIAFVLFMFKIIKIYNLIRQNSKVKNKGYSLVLLEEQHTAFSFFNYIFIGKKMQSREDIINHEIVHVKQRHSIDMLLFEFKKIVFWFNPYSYLYQSRIAELHEFIADSKSVSKKEKSTFINSLLAEVFRIDKIPFVNSFNNQSLIKKRIIMFNRNHSKKFLKIKYAFLIPVFIGMLVYTSCEKSTTEPENKLSVEEFHQEYFKDNKSQNSEKKSETVPFALIEKVPVYPGCENAEDQKMCMIEKITAYVSANFNASINNELNKENKKINEAKNLYDKVYVQFTIDKEGNVTDLKARAEYKELEQEALRVISGLPQFTPGEENGKKVSVKYTLPISLKHDA